MTTLSWRSYFQSASVMRHSATATYEGKSYRQLVVGFRDIQTYLPYFNRSSRYLGKLRVHVALSRLE